jgi:hypothetical protein
VLKLFTGKPGVMRTILAVYVLAVVVLTVLGHKEVAESFGGLIAWMLPADSPIDPAAAIAGLLAVVSGVRAFVRYLIEGFGPAPVK